MTGPADAILRMDGIEMRFGGDPVLEGVDFNARPGEVHVLAGENGAGKSTLIRILAGVYRPTAGRMEIAGAPYAPRHPLDAEAAGVAVIHQELSLVPAMSVADNVFLGRERTRAGWVRRAEQEREAGAILRGVGLEIDVTRAAEEFPIGLRQMIEIGKAVGRRARVLVMDEPTSALNAREAERLFERIAALKEHGCAIIYITHKMEEIDRLADRITVLRDGRLVGTAPKSDLPMGRMIEWMVGRTVDEQFPRHATVPGAELLRVEDFSVWPAGRSAAPAVDRVSLTVRAGEIVGLAGLQGCGATELMSALFGSAGGRVSGSVRLRGVPAAFRTPMEAIRRGVGYVTNDRRGSGLVPEGAVVFNATLAALPALSPGGWRSDRRERAAARAALQPLRLRAAGLDLPVAALSGGNQQKVVLAKWMMTSPSLLLLDEPTRGVDVGAKRDVYALLNDWTAAGMGILMTTSEMPELLAMSDRIVVLHRGRVTASLAAADATAERVLAAAMGGSDHE